MFTQDYSALGELETNWLLTQLEQSQGIVWHLFPRVSAGECGPRRPISRNHVSFWMEPLWKQVLINRSILLTFLAALKSLEKRKEKSSGVRKSTWRGFSRKKEEREQWSYKISAVLWPEQGRKENKLTSNYCSINCSFKARLLTLKYNPQLTSAMTSSSFSVEFCSLHSHLWSVYITLVTEIQLHCHSMSLMCHRASVFHSHCPSPQKFNCSYNYDHQVHLLTSDTKISDYRLYQPHMRTPNATLSRMSGHQSVS